MITRRTSGGEAPGAGSRQSRAQKFWAAAALAYLLLTLGLPLNAFAGAACEAPVTQVALSTDQQALRIDRAGIPATPVSTGIHQHDSHAFTEMVVGGHATALRWDRVPELVVLTPVMQYETGRGTQYRATPQRLTEDEADALVADLTEALSTLTGGVLQHFAGVRRETAAPGTMVNVMRTGQIVVARYEGVRDQLATIGFGGRSTRSSLIRAGSIILDSEFDRTSPSRRLLRAHELGHALGYNHVHSRPSIMNPKIGSEPTGADRAIARVAFRNFDAPASCS